MAPPISHAEANEDVDVVASPVAEREARALHQQREQHQHDEIGEDDHRQHELAQIVRARRSRK